MGLLSPSGGLIYHARSLRYRRLWAPFKRDIQQWLTSWNCPTQTLVIIGASAGHMIPRKWLRKFDRVVAYDIDPLAKALFRVRHFGSNTRYHVKDVFHQNGQLSAQAIDRVIRSHPHATILFANVWGQLLLHSRVTDNQWNHFLAELQTTLRWRQWASFHDLYTIEPMPHKYHGQIMKEFRQTKDITRALSPFSFSRNLVVTDHLLRQVSSGWAIEERQLAWSLTPASLHIVAAVRPASH